MGKWHQSGFGCWLAGTSRGTQGSGEGSEAKHTWQHFEIIQLLKTNLVFKKKKSKRVKSSIFPDNEEAVCLPAQPTDFP